MVQIPARKVEVQEEAVCIAKHAGVRLDAVLPDLFGSRYSSASGRAGLLLLLLLAGGFHQLYRAEAFVPCALQLAKRPSEGKRCRSMAA
jgi:hypothetical protein